jgi:tetratricopeptide (TPR) repeat protein
MSNELYTILNVSPQVDAKELRQAYFKALKQYPPDQHPAKHQEIRKAYETLGDEDKRKEYDALQKDDGVIGALLKEANELYQKDKYQEAEKPCKKAVVLAPDSINAKLLLGKIYFHLDEYTKSQNLLAECLSEKPNDFNLNEEIGYVMYASVYHETKDEPKNLSKITKTRLVIAQNCFDKCIEIAPANRAGYIGRARIEKYLTEYKKAITWVNKAINCDDKHDWEDFDSFVFLIDLYVYDGNLPKIIETIEYVVKLVPNTADHKTYAAERIMKIAAALYKADLFEVSYKMSTACLKIDPKHEGILKFHKHTSTLYFSNLECKQIQNDSSVPKILETFMLWGYFHVHDEFDSDEQAKKMLSNLVDLIFNQYTDLQLKRELQSIKKKYPNLWELSGIYEKILFDLEEEDRKLEEKRKADAEQRRKQEEERRKQEEERRKKEEERRKQEEERRKQEEERRKQEEERRKQEELAFARECSLDASNAGNIRHLKSLDLKMSYCPKASIKLSNDNNKQVRITKGYYISTTTITQAQWNKLMPENPSLFRGNDLPVEHVTWLDAVKFCNQLSIKENRQICYQISGTSVTLIKDQNGFRLPEEIEWENAAQAGFNSKYAGGNEIDQYVHYFKGSYLSYLFESYFMVWLYQNFPILKGLMKYILKESKTEKVKTKKPNTWGVYDMVGNVWEWCYDSSNGKHLARGGSHQMLDPQLKDRAFFDDEGNLVGFRIISSETYEIS